MFTQFRQWLVKLIEICEHDYQTLYQDNYRSIERCTKCREEIVYGDKY